MENKAFDPAKFAQANRLPEKTPSPAPAQTTPPPPAKQTQPVKAGKISLDKEETSDDDADNEDMKRLKLLASAQRRESFNKVPKSGEVPKPPKSEPIRVKIPSQVEVAYEIGKKIAEDSTKSTVSNMKATNKSLANKTIKRMEEIEEEDPDVVKRKIYFANTLNKYRKAYDGKIEYKFRSHYDHSKFSLAELEGEFREVETIINSNDIPRVIGEVLLFMADKAEYISKKMNNPYIRLHGEMPDQSFYNAVQKSIQDGDWDTDIEQLSMKYAHIFAQPPEIRCLIRLGYLAGAVMTRNAPNLRPLPKDQNSIYEGL
jgi:hypothetical protein